LKGKKNINNKQINEMVRIIITLVIYLISLVGLSQAKEAAELIPVENKGLIINIEINRTSSSNGKVFFALYDSEINFNGRNPLKVLEKEIENDTVKITFDGLTPGTYAITCYHDSNNNGKMDFQENGMPLEDYGATNNVMNFGPPRFHDAKFDLINKDLNFEIKF